MVHVAYEDAEAYARWSGKIAAGRKSNEIMHITDWFTTLLAMAGLPAQDDRVIDGKDQ